MLELERINVKEMIVKQHKIEIQEKPLIASLKGGKQKVPPIWLMRQAGRYLPEYRELRSKAGSFLDLVYDPDLAAEVTIQPIRRFGMDAAILFSDILVVPHAMGQNVKFIEGDGPKLDPVRDRSSLSLLSMESFSMITNPVYETVSVVRQKLDKEGFNQTALIGFAGAPWTVACYMVEGGGSRDFINIKKWAYAEPEGFGELIDKVTEATIFYLEQQITAGAEVIQLFDSWAGVLNETMFRKWVIEPTRRICTAINRKFPDIPVIGFPRGAGPLYLLYAQESGITSIALDQQVSTNWAANTLQPLLPVQGNLDPVSLLVGGDSLVTEVEDILGNLGNGPFVFNLGHGIVKETPPEHVEQLVKLVRA